MAPPPRRSWVRLSWAAGLLLAVVLVLGGVWGEGNAGVGGDDFGDLPDAEGDGGVVVALLGVGDHGAEDVAGAGVVEDAFEAVTYLDAASARIHDEEHEDAAIGSLGANLPFVFKRGGELFDGLVAVEGLDGDEGDLGVGLAIDLGAEGFNALLCGGGQDACEVADVTGWSREGAHRLRVEQGGRCEEQNDNGQPTREVLH